MNSIALLVEIKELFDDEVECFVRWQVLAITPEIGMQIRLGAILILFLCYLINHKLLYRWPRARIPEVSLPVFVCCTSAYITINGLLSL